jgi:VWFA-related protein
MVIKPRGFILLVVPLLCAVGVSAQQQAPPARPADAGSVVLDVVVTPKSGPPVSGIRQSDFTVLDNKVPQTLTSFQAVDGRYASVRIILLVDAVNVDYTVVSYERDQIDKFLRTDEGHLAHPTALAVLTEKGAQTLGDFSTDGNTLSASLDRYAVSLRFVNRTAGFWGATERLQYSLDGLQALAAHEGSGPGRTLVLCISPGWPLLSGPRVDLDEKKQQETFDEIVGLSTELLRNRVTLYSIDPLGSRDAGTVRISYWENFLKGVSKPSQVQLGNLALQVLASQSGGVVVTSSNDIAAMLRKCLSDTSAYYELSFSPALGDRPHEYHQLEIHVAERGLTARTRQGYYSQP